MCTKLLVVQQVRKKAQSMSEQMQHFTEGLRRPLSKKALFFGQAIARQYVLEGGCGELLQNKTLKS